MPDITADIELIEREADPGSHEKLKEFLATRNEIESHPLYLQTVQALEPQDEWIGQIFAIPIIWLVRPRREAQFIEACARMRAMLEPATPS